MISNKKQCLNHQIIISIKTPLKKEGLPLITLRCGEKDLTFLLDTGSSHCLISKSILKDIPHGDTNMSGKMYGIDGKISEAKKALLRLTYKDYDVYSGVFTISDLKFPKTTSSGKVVNAPMFHGILGTPFLLSTMARINYNNLKVYINGLFSDKQSKVQNLSDIQVDELERQLELLDGAQDLAVRL